MGDACSSGTSYMHLFHWTHNYVHQLKRKHPTEITFHKGRLNVHPPVLVGVSGVVVTNADVVWKGSSPAASAQLFQLLLQHTGQSRASAVPADVCCPSKTKPSFSVQRSKMGR